MSLARSILGEAFEESPSDEPTHSKVRESTPAPVLHFDRTDVSLFRNPATLAQKAGVQQEDLPKLALKELADNALDAGARVTFRHDEDGRTWVIDDGPGIDGTDEEIAAIFSFGRPLRSSKLLRLPTRGALGNGIRVVAGLVLCTRGMLVVRTRERELTLEPQDNGDTIVRSSAPWKGAGTEIGVAFGVEEDLLDWARVAADHVGRDGYKGASSPFWYDADSFFELCAASPPGLYVRGLVERLDGCSGAKAGKIAEAFLSRLARDLTRAEAAVLLDRARAAAKPVTPKRLGVVGEQAAFDGYGKAAGMVDLNEAQIPIVVEAWASGRQYGPRGVTLMVNRTRAPAAMAYSSYERHVWISGAHYSGEQLATGGNNYTVEINVQTPHMPVTSDGKAPDLAPFKALLDDAIRVAVNRAKRVVGVVPEERAGYRPTFKDAVLDNLDAAIADASGNGAFRFNVRNLYYALRPVVLRTVGATEFKYATFANIITDYENEHGPIPGMYRNERGVLILPHSGETIGLGTLSVERFKRPEWTFNKVLYVEKEGFFPALIAAKWPERHDCALMTSSGFASRAARDLIDALAETDEPIEIFCLHDCDAFGTKIYETLQEATRARPERKIEIVNLGLERAEAEAMGLQPETLHESRAEKPTAAYVSAEDREWYQRHRIELNDILTPRLIPWLDRKMAEHANGKVIPPADVAADRLRDDLEKCIRERETARILEEAGLEELVDEALADLDHKVEQVIRTLPQSIKRALAAKPADAWAKVVERKAAQLAEAPSC